MTTTRDLPKSVSAVPTVTLYGPAVCPDCEAVTGLLTRRGVAHTKIDIAAGDDDHAYVTEQLGYRQAPVVVVDLGDRVVHWGGRRPDMLMALAKLCTSGVQREPVAA